MGRVRAQVDLPALASQAEELWYDTARWPAFVDGLRHVASVQGDWPRAGARVVWDSQPGGAGASSSASSRYEPRGGQEVEVEDEKLRGTQRVSFAPHEHGVVVTLELRYALKQERGVERRSSTSSSSAARCATRCSAPCAASRSSCATSCAPPPRAQGARR